MADPHAGWPEPNFKDLRQSALVTTIKVRIVIVDAPGLHKEQTIAEGQGLTMPEAVQDALDRLRGDWRP